MRIWELMSATLPFLYHSNIWIRQGTVNPSIVVWWEFADARTGAVAFLTSAAEHLPPSDIWCILYPSLRHYLTSDVAEIDAASVLRALKPPVSFPLVSMNFVSFTHPRYQDKF